MNLKELMAACLKKQRDMLDAAKKDGRAFTAEEKTSFEALDAEFKGLKARSDAEELAASNAAYLNAPAPAPAAPVVNVIADPSADKPFKNLAEQLACIEAHARTGHADERLLKVQNASGATAGSGADGGFAIQKDFGGTMIESAVKDDPLLSLVDSMPISGNSDRFQWNELAETNVGTTIWGGIRTYWAAEAATATATKPQMQEREIKLLKLLGFYYNTMELEADSTFNSMVATRGFQQAIRRELASAIYSGDGIGKPLGMLRAAGLVSVAKESGQTADTVVWENVSKMYNRALGAKSDYVWLVHPDVTYQLENMVKVVGTGGVPVFLPAALAGSIDTLRGRPVYESDQNQALGDKGDIMFVKPKDYLLIYKGGIEQAASIHVGFLTAENCFRFIFRVNGMPKRNSALTIKNSMTTRSTIIALDARG